VAKRLGPPSVKTHRLIVRAVADGVVKVSVDGAIVECNVRFVSLLGGPNAQLRRKPA
jgi:PAS domain-containing protein